MPDSPRRPPTTQEFVLGELRSAIVAGDLSPGQPIRQDAIAQRLGVSRVPLREALKTLEAEGQVVYRPHRGYAVAELSLDDLVEVYRIRELLESEAARLAAGAYTEADLARITDAAADVDTAADDADLVGMIAANRRFHFALLEPAGMPRLIRMVRTLWDATDAYRAVYYNSGDNRERVRAEHGIDQRAFVIGLLGRLDANKRFEMVIEAAAPLLGEGCKLLVVGDGAERARLAALAHELRVAEHVVFAGERHDVAAMLSSFDLFVASSAQETFGLSVLEALANGMPALYTTCPALDGVRTDRARQVGAVSYVDGVQHCPHVPVRIAELGADFYATSAYKWAGPHLAAVAASDPWSLETLHPDKLAPSPDTVPDRFELGTNPFASMAGVVAAVEHLAGLDSDADGTRADRLAVSRRAARDHEDRLARTLFDGLAALDGVVRHGAPQGPCTPTAFFTVPGTEPAAVAEFLAARGLNVSHGHSYAWELVHALGVGETGGVRASLSHYTDESDVRRLLDALGDLSAG